MSRGRKGSKARRDQTKHSHTMTLKSLAISASHTTRLHEHRIGQADALVITNKRYSSLNTTAATKTWLVPAFIAATALKTAPTANMQAIIFVKKNAIVLAREDGETKTQYKYGMRSTVIAARASTASC